MNRFLIAFVALFISLVSFGQDAAPKLGYADTEYIMSQLPEAKKVESDLQAHYAQLESQLKAKAAEFKKKMDDYTKNGASWVDAVRADKERELQGLETAFQQFQRDAESSYQKKTGELMAPLYDKVGKAITEVSKENGYSFVLTLTAGGQGQVLLYKDPQYDVSKLVLKKLGVTPTAAVTPSCYQPSAPVRKSRSKIITKTQAESSLLPVSGSQHTQDLLIRKPIVSNSLNKVPVIISSPLIVFSSMLHFNPHGFGIVMQSVSCLTGTNRRP